MLTTILAILSIRDILRRRVAQCSDVIEPISTIVYLIEFEIW